MTVVDPRACEPPEFPPMPFLASIKAEGNAVCMTEQDGDALVEWSLAVKRWRVRWEAACGPLPSDLPTPEANDDDG